MINPTQVTSSNLPSKVYCPTSKSHGARALILACLNKENITLVNLPKAQDTQELIKCLEVVGIQFTRKSDNELTVTNSFPDCEPSELELELDLGEGGTTSRFLIPMLASGKRYYKIKFAGHMKNRPMQDLYNPLRDLGVLVKEESDHVLIRGPIDIEKTIVVNCEKSSQFASGLKLTNSVYPFKLELKNLNLSKKYFDLTNFVIEEMSKNHSYTIPADFSSAGYFIAYALFSESIKIENIQKLDYFQADSALVRVLTDAGADISFSDSGLDIRKPLKLLKGFIVDGNEFIDLIPTLLFIAAHIEGESTFKNLEGLIHKESNRLKEMLSILEYFEVNFTLTNDGKQLSVIGKKAESYSRLRGDFSIQTAVDHRMVMVATLFMKLRGGGEIGNSQAVAKSFPSFFSFFK